LKNYIAFILITFVVFFTTQLNAQKENNIVYGILMEYQKGQIYFDEDINDFDIRTSGVAIGILAEAPIVKSLLLGIQPKIVLGESKFSQFNPLTSSQQEIEQGNIEVQLPLYLQYVFQGKKVDPLISVGYSYNINVTAQEEVGVLILDKNYHSVFSQVGLDIKNNFFTWTPYFGFESSVSNITDIYNSNDELINSRKVGFQAGVKFKGPRT